MGCGVLSMSGVPNLRLVVKFLQSYECFHSDTEPKVLHRRAAPSRSQAFEHRETETQKAASFETPKPSKAHGSRSPPHTTAT